MASRPRRSAAQRANEAITDMADRDAVMSARPRRSTDGRGLTSPSADSGHHVTTVKVSASKLRQATERPQPTGRSSREIYTSAEMTPKRSTRPTAKRRYVESSEEDGDEDAEGEEDDDDTKLGGGTKDDDDDEMEDDEDADGEVDDEMDVDAEGEEDEDADGDVDMESVRPPPTIKISKPAGGANKAKSISITNSRPSRIPDAAPAPLNDDDEEDDEELSDLDSDVEEDADETRLEDGEEDAEGEEDDVDDDDEDAEGEDVDIEPGVLPEGDDLDSMDGSRAGTPDLTKMTRRQRARFEDEPQEYMKLSDEVQVKKHFTAEELSMRRAEMARRRRNLSEKRNEEVKNETINKLLKRQAPKTTKRAANAGGEEGEDEPPRPEPIFIRWVNNRQGSHVSVPEEVLSAPVGSVYAAQVAPKLAPRKMVEEVV